MDQKDVANQKVANQKDVVIQKKKKRTNQKEVANQKKNRTDQKDVVNQKVANQKDVVNHKKILKPQNRIQAWHAETNEKGGHMDL